MVALILYIPHIVNARGSMAGNSSIELWLVSVSLRVQNDRILEITRFYKNCPKIITPQPKLKILVSFSWKKK